MVSVRKIKREEKHNRKRGALSARSSLSDADSNENGYILFEGKRTMLGWMIDSAIVPLNGKVQCKNTEGTITKEGIRCNCCDEVFSVLDFEVHSGISKAKQCLKGSMMWILVVEIKMMIHVLYAGTREILTAVMVARQLSIRAAWALKSSQLVPGFVATAHANFARKWRQLIMALQLFPPC